MTCFENLVGLFHRLCLFLSNMDATASRYLGAGEDLGTATANKAPDRQNPLHLCQVFEHLEAPHADQARELPSRGRLRGREPHRDKVEHANQQHRAYDRE
jgi:hypothetical protein